MERNMNFDVIVVGAGIEGSATAYNLAKSGHATLLIDQFALPHTRGSSHGQSRVIRKAYTQSYYSEMMISAYKMWTRFEQETGVKLFQRTGLLNVSPKQDPLVQDIRNSLDGIGAEHEDLDAWTVNKRFPMIKVASDYHGVYDPAAGTLRADKALGAFWEQFKKLGGTIYDAEPVISITPGDAVVVTTSKAQYRCKSVVLCLGPWTSKIIKPLGLHLPLQPVRVAVYYWKATNDNYKGTPCVSGNIDNQHIYGMPCYEYPNHVKLCFHGGPEIDPDMRDAERTERGSNDICASMKKIVRDHFPGLEPYPSIQETCIYTFTPDENFVLDTHPHWKNVVVGAGFSGHGFKLAPVVGTILADLATGREPDFNTQPFRIERFFRTTNSAKL